MTGFLLAGLGLGLACICAALADEAGVGKVERSGTGLDPLVPKDAKIEKLAGDFKFTEGPVWTRDGVLLFSDIPNNVIRKWDPKSRQLSDFRSPSANSNGNTLDAQGRLVSCEHSGRRVSRREADGSYSTVVDKYQGKRLNSPNDVIFK